MEAGNKTGKSLTCEINVTPLVDVMLVVLIIFMVVTPMLQKGVGVNLPLARNVRGVSEDTNQVLMVTLEENGRMSIGSEPIVPAGLIDVLKARYQSNPGLQLQIKADRDVRFGEVKGILQAAREAGFDGADMIARESRPGGETEGRPASSPAK